MAKRFSRKLKIKKIKQRGGVHINGFEYAAAQHDGYKTPTEDRMTILSVGDSCLLVAVFDGHVGSACAEYINTNLPGQIAAEIEVTNSFANPAAIQQIVRDKFVDCNAAFLAAFPADQSGSTGSVVIITPTHLISANTGDSPIILYNDADKRVLLESVDHDPSNFLEVARLQAVSPLGVNAVAPRLDGAMGFCRGGGIGGVFVGELAVTRAFGDRTYIPFGLTAIPDISITPRPNTATTLLVMSDSFSERIRWQAPCIQLPQGGNMIKNVATGQEIVNDLALHAEVPQAVIAGANPPLSAALLDDGVANAVEYQVEKFLSGGRYHGDNTTLVAVKLPAVAAAAAAAAAAPVAAPLAGVKRARGGKRTRRQRL